MTSAVPGHNVALSAARISGWRMSVVLRVASGNGVGSIFRIQTASKLFRKIIPFVSALCRLQALVI